MGLELPAVMPQPRGFQLDAHDVARLERFLDQESPRLIQIKCEPEEIVSPHYTWSASGTIHLLALLGLRDGCGLRFFHEADELVEQTMRQGSVNETFQELWAQATAANQAWAAELDSHAAPANLAEMEISGAIMDQYRWSNRTIGTAVSLFENWTTSPDPTDDLATSYANLMIQERDGRVFVEFLRSYPWEDPTRCEQPDRGAWHARTLEKLDVAASMILPHTEPRDRENILSPYVRINNTLRANLEFFASRGWTPGSYNVDTIANWYVAIGSNLSASTFPNAAESEYLIAQFRNQTRTLWTEYLLKVELLPHVDWIEARADANFIGARVLGLGALRPSPWEACNTTAGS